MSEDPWRARQAWHHGLGDEDPHAASVERSRPGSPASRPTWSQFLRAQGRAIRAIDFVTVETAWLQTLYVLFAIEIRSRRVDILGVTQNPDSAWVTQQARNLARGDRLDGIRLAIRDRDAKFSGPFDQVFRSEGVKIVKTAIRAPRANAFAERWVRTVRAECRDWMQLLGRHHLAWVFRTYAAPYNGRGPTGVLGSRRRTPG